MAYLYIVTITDALSIDSLTDYHILEGESQVSIVNNIDPRAAYLNEAAVSQDMTLVAAVQIRGRNGATVRAGRQVRRRPPPLFTKQEATFIRKTKIMVIINRPREVVIAPW
jgi:hypothetical protein